MKRTISSVFFSALLVFGMTTAAFAKEGFYLGLQVPYNMVDGDFDNTTMPEVDPGAGFGLIAGYTFIPSLSIEIDWSGSSHKSAGATIGLGEFTLNGKFSFMTNELQPYLFAGVGAFTLGDDSLTLGGTGYNLGLGADYYVNPNISFGAGLIRKFITYDDVVKPSGYTLSKDIKGDTTSIRFDVSYHF